MFLGGSLTDIFQGDINIVTDISFDFQVQFGRSIVKDHILCHGIGPLPGIQVALIFPGAPIAGMADPVALKVFGSQMLHGMRIHQIMAAGPHFFDGIKRQVIRTA